MNSDRRSCSQIASGVPALLTLLIACSWCPTTCSGQLDSASFIVEGMESPVIRVIEGAIRRIEREPDSYERWYQFAATLDAHELLDEAATYYQKALSLRPGHMESLYNCGLVFEYLGRHDDAKKSWDQILSKDPGHPHTNFRVGEYHFRNGALDEALACFQIFIADHPESAMGHSRIGRTLLQLNRPDEALAELNRVLESEPLDRPTLVSIAQAYLRSGDREKAQQIQQQLKDDESLFDALALIDPLRAAVTVRAVNSNTCIARAEKHERIGEYACALKEYQLAAVGQPLNAKIEDRIGKLLVRLDLSADAILHFDRAIALDPTLVNAYHNRGFAREKLGQRKEAIAEYLHVLEMEPDHPLSTERLKKLGEL
jgi:tetratricopeptide (TPR) repeat protein